MPVQSATPDSIVQLTADAEGLALMAPADLPRSGTFWWMMAGGAPVPAPCPPQDLSVPIYQLADGQFLVDETGGQVAVNPRRFGSQAQSTVASALAAQADEVVNLIAQAQTAVVNQQMRAMGMDIPGFGGGGDGGDGGTNDYNPADNPISIPTPDYGTNLWLAITNLANNAAGLFISNTAPEIEYEVQYTTDLLQPWQSAGWFVYGSELTNWTPFSVSAFSPTNLFLRVRSWQDDGSGLPLWWQQQYFGTNGVDPYGDSMGDGWNNLQKFQNGMNPNVFYTPPAPQGLAVNYNSFNNTAAISWQPSPGPVTGYTVEKTDSFIPGGVQTNNVSAGATSFQDDVSSSVPDAFDDGALDVSYKIQAHYSGGGSSWSDAMPLEQNPVPVNITAGPQGSAYASTPLLPSGTTALRVTLIDKSAWLDYYWGYGSEPVNPTFDIPVSDPAQGQYLIPAWSSQVAEAWQSSYAVVQAVNTSGNISAPSPFNPFSSSLAVPPFFDGRAQLKQNLIFLLRSATVDSPFNYLEVNTNTSVLYTFTNPRNYAFAGFYPLDEAAADAPFYDESVGNFDAYWPFESNYRYRNFVFSSTNLDSNGRITTGAGGVYYGYNIVLLASGSYNYYPAGLLLKSPPAFQFQTPMTNGATIPALLATNNTRWLASYALDSSVYDLWKIGATNSEGVIGLFNNVRNWFGLPILSINISGTTTLYAGNVTTADGHFYPETAQPQFQLSEYDFWQRSPIPGSSSFSTTNKSDLLIAPVGGSIMINGYAKLAVTNGYPGVYGYLGQYFTTNAYALDSSGNITTNTTGILSPYGNFFATEPGPAALVTMPDIDTGQRGTGTVYCVSLNVDANHDGNMDLSFNGPDATSQSSPMEFWVNSGWDDQNGVDRPNYGNTNYMDAMINWPRDLENFARLWVCGMPALPSAQGYTVTLSWQNVSGNPAINLFRSVETNGGIGYLTDTNVAAAQTVLEYPNGAGLIFGQVRSDAPASFPADFFTNNTTKYFLFEGAGVGSGELTMTISQNGNTIAQTGVWLDLHDIKDFYEQAHITGVPTTFPAMVTTTNTSGFSSDHEVATSADETKQLIVFVHGWRMGMFDYQDFSDTMFKRLYWAGYKGRFASLRWPTLSADDYRVISELQSYTTYNRSEHVAFDSGAGTCAYLDWLRTRFSDYSIGVTAHSMGNVVMAEALKDQLAEGHHAVDNYVMMQAAITAHCYDTSLPDYSVFTAAEASSHTPDIYRGYPGNIAAAVNNQIVNFFNTNDFALAKGTFLTANVSWEGNEKNYKPDWVQGYTSDGTHCFHDVSDIVTNPHEQMAFVARPRAKAAGALEGISGAVSGELDLTGAFNFQNNSDEHSAEFNWTIQQLGGPNGFYKTLLQNIFQ